MSVLSIGVTAGSR